MSRKKNDERIIGNATTHGRRNKYLAEIKNKLDISALSKVEKMQFESMLHEINARALAVEMDGYINKILLDKVKSTDHNLMNYEADLIATQIDLATKEKDLAFHRKVLADLQEEYLETGNKDLLEQIDAREKAIKEYDRLRNQTLEIRNKIRTMIDKNKYNEKSLKLKEETQKGSNAKVIDVKDIDYKMLDDI